MDHEALWNELTEYYETRVRVLSRMIPLLNNKAAKDRMLYRRAFYRRMQEVMTNMEKGNNNGE